MLRICHDLFYARHFHWKCKEFLLKSFLESVRNFIQYDWKCKEFSCFILHLKGILSNREILTCLFTCHHFSCFTFSTPQLSHIRIRHISQWIKLWGQSGSLWTTVISQGRDGEPPPIAKQYIRADAILN